MTVFSGAPPRRVQVEVLPERPSEGPGRTHVQATQDIATADATVYTVTAGKTLYVMTLFVSFRNTSSVSAAALRIRDGNGGDVKFAVEMSSGVAGGITPHGAFSLTFPEPKRFTNAVFVDVSGGSPSYSATIVGYEEVN